MKNFTMYNIETGRVNQLSDEEYHGVKFTSYEKINGVKVSNKDGRYFFWRGDLSFQEEKRIISELHWKYNIYKGLM